MKRKISPPVRVKIPPQCFKKPSRVTSPIGIIIEMAKTGIGFKISNLSGNLVRSERGMCL